MRNAVHSDAMEPLAWALVVPAASPSAARADPRQREGPVAVEEIRRRQFVAVVEAVAVEHSVRPSGRPSDSLSGRSEEELVVLLGQKRLERQLPELFFDGLPGLVWGQQHSD